MRSRDIKKQNVEEEVYEEVEENVFGTEKFQSPLETLLEKTKIKLNEYKKNKLYWPVVIFICFILFVLIVYLSFNIGGTGSIKGLSEIQAKVPEIIYMDTPVSLNVDAYGAGDLSKTEYTFELSNLKSASLSSDKLVGSSVNNMITPLKTGSFSVNIKGVLGNKKKNITTKTITVCNRIRYDMFPLVIDLDYGETKTLKFDIDSPQKCYDDISFVVTDQNICSYLGNNKIIGLNKGTTTLSIMQDNKKFDITINVK